MSQASGMAGGDFSKSANFSSTGRALIVLALAVSVGIVLLNGLDDTTSAQQAAISTEAAPSAPAAAPIDTVPPSTLPARSPSEVKVLVANGTEVQGAASRVASRLQPIGYELATPNNMTTPITGSAVLYAEGYQAEAEALATSLGLSADTVSAMPIPAPVEDLQEANLIAVVGSDLSGQADGSSTLGAEGSSGAAAPSTTAAPVANPLLNGPLSQGGGANSNQ